MKDYEFNSSVLRCQKLPNKGDVLWKWDSNSATKFTVADSYIKDDRVYIVCAENILMNKEGERLARELSLSWYYKEGYDTTRHFFNKHADCEDYDYKHFDIDKHFEPKIYDGNVVTEAGISRCYLKTESFDRLATYDELVKYITSLQEQLKEK